MEHAHHKRDVGARPHGNPLGAGHGVGIIEERIDGNNFGSCLLDVAQIPRGIATRRPRGIHTPQDDGVGLLELQTVEAGGGGRVACADRQRAVLP